MTKLRHAGSPVEQPEKLSRAKQNAILLWAGVNTRIVAKRMRIRFDTTLAQEMVEARANLRLDDPVLDDLITRKESSGQPWGPWESTTYKPAPVSVE